MTVVVSLRDVVMEMDVFGDELKSFFNKRTGEFIALTSDELGAAETSKTLKDYPEWQQERIRKGEEVLFSDEWLRLPDKFEIHEYAIMEDFSYAVEDEELRNLLLYKIRGSGAFRRFKDAIHECEITDTWYRYRQRTFERIAVKWLEANEIAYTRE